jgi:hypothetical protein
MDQRYEGKPLLRLIECYVLRAINALSEEQNGALEELTPYLQKTYNRTGSWHEIIAAQMEFPSDLPERIRGMWSRNQEIAKRVGDVLEPEQFAQMFVDSNIDHSIA